MTGSRYIWAVTAIVLSAFTGVLIALSLPKAVTEHGAFPWIAERVFAFMSYWVITASVVYGLLLSTKLLRRFAHHEVGHALHKDLAMIALGLAGIHGALLVLDDELPYSVYQVLIPGLSPYEPAWVAIGQLSLYLLALVALSLLLRRCCGFAVWRAVNVVMIFAFFAATLHGLIVGTDSQEEWAVWVYSIATCAVVVSLLYRLYVALNIFCDVRRARREEERRARIGLSK